MCIQLMDLNGSHQMNFHSFVLLFGLMSKATLQERLKLLYILHLTQLLDQKSNGGKFHKGSVDCESSKNIIITSVRIV